MKKIALIICLTLIVLIITGCAEIVSVKPIDTEYIAAYDAMETVYSYKYDWVNGEIRYLPEFKMVHHDDEYKVQYEQTWSNGITDTYWVTVTKTEYESALKAIEKGGGE